jgi:hypothetical protein
MALKNENPYECVERNLPDNLFLPQRRDPSSLKELISHLSLAISFE